MKGSRRIRLLPKHRGDPRASAVAFLLQLTLITIIVPTLVVPVAFEMLRDSAGREVMPERISYLTAVPRPVTAPSREAPRAGGDGRRVVEDAVPEPQPPAPVVAPGAVPEGVASPSTAAREDDPGTGPLIGGGGPTRGIQPSFTDPRLWQEQVEIVSAPMVPRTRADTLREILWATARTYADSVAIAEATTGRVPGDWTFQRDGKTYGIDPRFIRLGKFSIPTAILALLPMNVQANPMAMERARSLSLMRSEIMEQAARQEREDEFRNAVRALRERKERERREAEEKRRASQAPIPARP